MTTKDLTSYTQDVFNSKDLPTKKAAMLKLIEVSYAKDTTKTKARNTVEALKNPAKLDAFAVNYMLSGEGMKVF